MPSLLPSLPVYCGGGLSYSCSPPFLLQPVHILRSGDARSVCQGRRRKPRWRSFLGTSDTSKIGEYLSLEVLIVPTITYTFYPTLMTYTADLHRLRLFVHDGIY